MVFLHDVLCVRCGVFCHVRKPNNKSVAMHIAAQRPAMFYARQLAPSILLKAHFQQSCSPANISFFPHHLVLWRSPAEPAPARYLPFNTPLLTHFHRSTQIWTPSLAFHHFSPRLRVTMTMTRRSSPSTKNIMELVLGALLIA